ncbi:MCE family protein [bacterium]|nr:MCE family protein [bacterium]
MAQSIVKKTYKRELRVGSLILLALTIMVAVVFALGGQKKMFGKKVKYRILFSQTGGLYTGDPVLLTGVEVGNVSLISFPEDLNQQKILVEIEVLKEVAPRIRLDSRARIASASIVYGKLVALSMGSMSFDAVTAGEYITAEDPTDMLAIVDSTTGVMTDIRRVLGKLDDGPGMLSQLLNEPAQLQSILLNLDRSSRHLASLLARASNSKGAVGTLLADTVAIAQTLSDMQAASANLKKLSMQMASTKSVFGRLVNDEEYGKAVGDDLKTTLHHLANITAKIDSGQGAVAQLLNDPSIYHGLQDIVLGIERSSMAKWLIQNRRKAGEKTKKNIETLPER